MKRRRMQQMRNADITAHTQQARQLMKANEALRSEHKSEPQQQNVVAAGAGPQQKKPTGRQGAKQVKRLEQLSSTLYGLSPEEATMYRALSARCNFLAHD